MGSSDNCLCEATLPNVFQVTTVYTRQLFPMGFGANNLREKTPPNGFQ